MIKNIKYGNFFDMIFFLVQLETTLPGKKNSNAYFCFSFNAQFDAICIQIATLQFDYDVLSIFDTTLFVIA